MRALMSALSCLSLAGLLLLTSAATVFSQDRPEAGHSPDLRREWYNLAHERTEFEISDLQQLPGSLRLAAEHFGCRYKEGIGVVPVRFVRTANRRVAIVTCWGPLKSHQRVFDLSDLQRPVELQFPIAVPPVGFGASSAAPGFVTWEKETGLFRTETTSDVAYSSRERYTYRLDGGESGFVVLRVEVQRDGVGEWITIWDAPRWSGLAKPN